MANPGRPKKVIAVDQVVEESVVDQTVPEAEAEVETAVDTVIETNIPQETPEEEALQSEDEVASIAIARDVEEGSALAYASVPPTETHPMVLQLNP